MSALRRIKPDIPAVLVSGHDEPKAVADRPERPQFFINKMAELKDAVTRVMKGEGDKYCFLWKS